MTPESTTSPIRVLLVDDHALVTRALRMLLETEPGIVVAGEARSRVEAVDLVRTEEPDVVLLDLDLGGDSGLDAIRELQTVGPSSRILILTGLRDADVHRQALARGARGVVEKESAADRLIEALRAVHAGACWTEGIEAKRPAASGAEMPEPDGDDSKIARLSARERDVLVLLGEGLSNRRIAERLFISETTVRHHLTSIFAKLEVHDRLELLLYSYRKKLISPPMF